MKRTFLSLFLIGLFFLPSLACGSMTINTVEGSGKIVTQTIDVNGFDRVTLEGSGNVILAQGQTESLSVEADDNIFPLLDIRVSGRELILGIKNGTSINPSQPIVYNLTVKNLSHITLSGSGSFDVGPLQSSELQISIPGSGDIKVKSLHADQLAIDLGGSGKINLENIQVKILDASLKGSGDIKLAGTTKEQKVTVSGSGNYLAGDLQAKAANISVPGSADVTVWVTKELKITVNGSGDVQYYGNPVLNQNGSGSGKITALGDKS